MNIKKAGIVCCSNGLAPGRKQELDALAQELRGLGIQPIFGEFLYAKDSEFSGTAKERAESLMGFYRDESIDAVFDVSGGDLANELLEELDYSVIQSSRVCFWGYSDLTTIINAIYTKTGKASVLYQVRNLVSVQVQGGIGSLFEFSYQFLQKKQMHGIVVGGNIRCLLKLAGTEYFPDLTDKILLLEAYSGGVPQMVAYLSQLKQLGAFRKVSGILLGTFTKLEEEGCGPAIFELVRQYAGEELPIAATAQIGHGTDARSIWIGKELSLGGR